MPETAAKEGLKPLEYMRKYGAFEVTTDVYKLNEKPVVPADLAGSQVGKQAPCGNQPDSSAAQSNSFTIPETEESAREVGIIEN